MSAVFENAVIVTRRTELDELVARFNTVSQARFYLEHVGRDFAPIQAAHRRYQSTLSAVRSTIPRTLKSQVIDRALVPRFTFGEADLVVTVGQDGLVSNTAKYLSGQPILAVNPDPERFDGILLPFTASDFDHAIAATLAGAAGISDVTLAQAELSDGQRLLAFNDFFIGASSHVSARYSIKSGQDMENHSSSGIIVSTGAGSTGWLQSVYAGAAGVVTALGGRVIPPPQQGRLDWDEEYLVYAVREPFPSKTTGTSMVYGTVTQDKPLVVSSSMSTNGVIFSDGVEADYMAFNNGTKVVVSISPEKARLVTSVS